MWRTPALAVSTAGLLAAALFPGEEEPWKLEAPKPSVELRPARLDQLEGETCSECHAGIVEEWAGTAHAVAWVDEIYQDEIEDRTRPQSCHGCHIPKPLLASGLPKRPEARDERKHLGISCEACHLGPKGEMLGPWGTETTAHGSALSEHMTAKGSSTMCAVCHSTNIGPVVGIAKDFFTAKMEDRGRSCVGCHMAPVERQPSKGSAERAPTRTGRSHAIQTPRDPTFLARAFEPSLRIDGGKSVVTIRNLAGHRVPGLIGRKIELRAELQDGAGKVVGDGKVVLDARSYLAVDGQVEIELGGGGTAVRLRGFHQDPRSKEPVEFLDASLQPSGR